MKGNAQLMNLDRNCIKFILENHELFSPEEVKIAAKREVEFRKKTSYENQAQLSQLANLQAAKDYHPYVMERARNYGQFSSFGIAGASLFTGYPYRIRPIIEHGTAPGLTSLPGGFIKFGPMEKRRSAPSQPKMLSRRPSVSNIAVIASCADQLLKGLWI